MCQEDGTSASTHVQLIDDVRDQKFTDGWPYDRPWNSADLAESANSHVKPGKVGLKTVVFTPLEPSVREMNDLELRGLELCPWQANPGIPERIRGRTAEKLVVYPWRIRFRLTKFRIAPIRSVPLT